MYVDKGRISQLGSHYLFGCRVALPFLDGGLLIQQRQKDQK
jgi:hypothetical protein